MTKARVPEGDPLQRRFQVGQLLPQYLDFTCYPGSTVKQSFGEVEIALLGFGHSPT
jgi:hypothetical protein